MIINPENINKYNYMGKYLFFEKVISKYDTFEINVSSGL